MEACVSSGVHGHTGSPDVVSGVSICRLSVRRGERRAGGFASMGWWGICKTLPLLSSPEFHGGEVTLKLCQVSLNHGSSIFKQVDHHDDVVWVIFLQYTYLPSIAESCSLY